MSRVNIKKKWVFLPKVETTNLDVSTMNVNDYTPASPFDFPDMLNTVTLLIHAVNEREKLFIVSSMELDSLIAAAMLVSIIKTLGGDVQYASALETPNLSVSTRTSQGKMEIIGYAAISPAGLTQEHPMRYLPVAGVVYKLLEGVLTQLGQPEKIHEYEDLVGLAILARQSILRGEVRYLLQQSLLALRSTKRAGIKGLMEQLGSIDENVITQKVIPRLRMLRYIKKEQSAIDFFLAEQTEQVLPLLVWLEEQYTQWKHHADQVHQAALKKLEQQNASQKRTALFIEMVAIPPEISGSVVARLAHEHQRTVTLISLPQKENTARASLYWMESIPLREAFMKIQPLIEDFREGDRGCRFSIAVENIPSFQALLKRAVQGEKRSQPVEATLEISGVLNLGQINKNLVQVFEQLAPFGEGNQRPIFATRGLNLVDTVTIGRNREHLSLNFQDGSGVTREVLWWFGAGQNIPSGSLDIAYHLQLDKEKSSNGYQVILEDIREEQPELAEVSLSFIKQMTVNDYRSVDDIEKTVSQIIHYERQIQVWCEATPLPQLPEEALKQFTNRFKLCKSPALIIWSAPPGSKHLEQVLANVKPDTVYVFSLMPQTHIRDVFIKTLMGMVKYALRVKQGRILISELAAATAQTENTISQGLKWIAAQEKLVYQTSPSEDECWLFAADDTSSQSQTETEVQGYFQQLKAFHEESAAYRNFFAQVKDIQDLDVFKTSLL